MPRVTLLEDVETPYGRIEIVRARSGAVLYRQGTIHQSESDGNGVSLATYIHAIFSLLIQAWARNVLLIGCGGGVLGTMLSATGARVTVVDVNEVSLLLARKHFGMPDSITTHVADGAKYLELSKRKFDAIVMDAYHDGDAPAHLDTPEVLANAAARLTRAGLFIANVYLRDDDDPRARDLAARAAGAWKTVRVLDMPGEAWRNAIVMAGRVASLNEPELVLRPRIGARAIADELKRFVFV
ncbi:MAG: fused MFS/spermidine synthase [Alphaproteobacteria bacterium]|nr:fused MFS/spermidine synthase [Alphaproteobacteria bacterium]